MLSAHSAADAPNNEPITALWLHEIKHDGFRIIARKNGERVKLYSRPGNDLMAALAKRWRQ